MLALYFSKSHTEAVTCVLQIITYEESRKEWSAENQGKHWWNHDARAGAAAVYEKEQLTAKQSPTVQKSSS